MNFKKLILTGILASAIAIPSHIAFAQTSDFYQVWKDEAASKSLNPSSLDILSNGVYTNYQFGYKMNVPTGWEMDNHQVPNYTRFFNQDFRLDIYFEDVSKDYKTVDQYISDTISAIQNNITNKGTYYTNSGLKIQTVEYKRDAVPGINGDMTSYEYFFVSSGSYVYTYQLKTSDTLFVQMKSDVLNTVIATVYSTPNLINPNDSFAPNSISPNINVKAENRSLEIAPNKIAFGVYEPGDASNINKRETTLGTHFGSQMFYEPISNSYDSYVNTMVADGRIPLVTMHFDYINDTTTASQNVENIISGNYDQQINSWAQGIKNTKSPVLVRLGNEMNADWTTWSSKNMYNDPDLYVLAYRHIVDIYRADGVSNAYFVWNPNNISKPNYSWNDAALYYPGSNYVDWVGMTHYNFGTSGKDYQYFDDLYGNLYKTYMRSFAGKPMLIGEFASSETGGNKPYFIKDMFQTIEKKYPNIKLVIWFNGEPENGLPMDSSVEVQSAFKDAVQYHSIVNHPVIDNISSGLQINEDNNSETTDSKWILSGSVVDSNIQSLFLNGMMQTLSGTGQFNQSFTLKSGENKIIITVNYKDGTKNEFNYYIYKKSSFKFTTNLGEKGTIAPTTNQFQMSLEGSVVDKNISSLKINDIDVPLDSNNNFKSQLFTIQYGLNQFVVKGFDSTGNVLITETYYLFKDGNLKVTSPFAQFSNIYGHSLTVTGMSLTSNVKWIKVDGTIQTLKWSWNQFDQPLSFGYGDDSFYVDGIYEFLSPSGEEIDYPVHYQYTVHAPSFDFLNYVSYFPSNAGVNSSGTDFVSGIVKDQKIHSLKINGQPVALLYAWNQFRQPVTLQNGINVFTLTGYSDANYQNPIVNETVYLFKDGDLNITSPKNSYTESTNNSITVTGMVPNSKITSVKVNGVIQTLQYSWRQFDQSVSLSKPGNNQITVEASYKDVVNGISYSKTIDKAYIVHKPSFNFVTPVSHSMSTAPETSESSKVINGTLIDSSVKALKINGKQVTINSDNTISSTVTLNPGMNGIVLSGYSDSQYQNKLFDETVYIFNDSGFTVKSPTVNNIILNSKLLTVSGVLEYNAYKSIKINGQDTPLIYTWRQFSKDITLPIGKNTITLEALYQSSLNGQSYSYIARKVYTVIVPIETSSYKFTTPIGSTQTTAPTINSSMTWIGALVKDGNINYVKVNGAPVNIYYSWKQFSSGVPLKFGINAITIEGFTDSSYKNKISQETFYINRSY